MALPTVSLGNLATDISGAAAGFVKGLQEEKERRRAHAMEEALLQVRAMQAMKPEASDTQIIPIPTEKGLVYGRVNKLTNQVDFPTNRETQQQVPAPLQQYVSTGQTSGGDLTQLVTPRIQLPGTQPTATQVNLPPGQQPRDVKPSPIVTEGPNGPHVLAVDTRKATAREIMGPTGQPLQPRAQQFEVEKAQFAANMDRAAKGMEMITTSAPEAVDEAVQRLNVQGVLQSLPVIGAPAGEVAQRAIALGISPEAATWLANFYTFIGFAVPELAGKQMTITEMRQQINMFAPLIGEPEAGRRVKLENIRFRVESAKRAAGPGVTRVGEAPASEPLDINPLTGLPRRRRQ